MQDLLAFLVVLIVAVAGAEGVRATCRRQLSAPVRVPAQAPQRSGVVAD